MARNVQVVGGERADDMLRRCCRAGEFGEIFSLQLLGDNKLKMLAVAGSVAALAVLVLRNQPAKGKLPGLPGPVPDGDDTIVLKTTGSTRYRLADEGNPKRLVVLIHGISYPMDCMTLLFETLVRGGHNVLLYDITGRGYSHSSGAPMTGDLYLTQLTELLQQLELFDRKIDIVAWSMGTIVASFFARKYPSKVSRVVLLAPPGGARANKPFTANLLHLPLGIGSALGKLAVGPTLLSLYKKELKDVNDGGRLLRLLQEHVRKNPGLVRAIISSLHHCPELDDNRPALAALGQSDASVQVFWGTADITIPRAAIDGAMKLLPNADLHVLDGVGHSLFLTHPQQCVPKIVEFLTNND